MYLSYDIHAQAVRDRQQALRRDADVHRLVASRRLPLADRLRCAAARLRLPRASREACGKAATAAAR
jgi:hypothetical protein